jgi:hypothetical protein
MVLIFRGLDAEPKVAKIPAFGFWLAKTARGNVLRAAVRFSGQNQDTHAD